MSLFICRVYPTFLGYVNIVNIVNIDNIVISVLSNGAPEANAARAVFAEALDVLAPVVEAAENVVVLCVQIADRGGHLGGQAGSGGD